MQVYSLNSRVRIGNYVFDSKKETGIIGAKIDFSKDQLTGKAVVRLPHSFYFKDKLISDLIKVGDSVELEFGYNGKYWTDFKGYVSKIEPSFPVVVTCEDEMYQLKKAVADKSWKTVTLQELISHVVPSSYAVKMIDPSMALGKFLIHHETTAMVFDKLKKDFGLSVFFRENKLFVGFRFQASFNTHKYDFAANVKSHQLKLKTKEQTKIKIKAIALQKNGKKLIVEVGDPDGAVRTMHYAATTKEELRYLAEQELANWKFDGLEGIVTGFGYPQTMLGDLIELTSSTGSFPEYRGTYQVDGLTISFENGYQRTEKLGLKV